MVTEDDVRRIALRLPGAYEQQSYDACPSWRTTKRMFTWIRNAPDAVVVWVPSLEDKEALLASDPGKYFTTPHYDGYPVVLIDMDRTGLQELTGLIQDSWRVRAPKTLTAGWERDPEVP